MTNSTKYPRIAFLIPLVILYLTVGQLQLLTPFISVAVLYVIALVLVFFLDRRAISYPFIPWWILFSVVIILNNFSGDTYFNNIIQVLSVIFFISFSCITANYSSKQGGATLSKYILRFFLFAVVYLTTCSLIIEIGQPGVLRYATGLSYQGDNSLLTSLTLRGMSNYYLPHAMPMLIPPIVMGIKNKELPKTIHLLLFLLLAVVFVLIYVSYATTPLLFAILFLIVSLFVKQGSIRNNIVSFIIVIAIFAPLLLSDELLLSLLVQVDSITGGEGELHGKIAMFQESLISGKATGDMEERIDLYKESASFLKSNWIIGTNGPVGGHSVFIDVLASLGLIGFIPLFMIIYRQIKYTIGYLPKPSHIYYYLSMAAGLLMLLTKSMNNWEMWLVLFCIAPLLTLQLSKSK